MAMPVNIFSELEHIYVGLHRGGMGSEDYTSDVLARNCTSMNGTFADIFDRVLSTITKVRDTQQTINEH